jgi:hypothetical protein
VLKVSHTLGFQSKGNPANEKENRRAPGGVGFKVGVSYADVAPATRPRNVHAQTPKAPHASGQRLSATDREAVIADDRLR